MGNCLEFRERLQIWFGRILRIYIIFYAMRLHKIIWWAHQYLRFTKKRGIQQKRMKCHGQGFRRKPGVYVLEAMEGNSSIWSENKCWLGRSEVKRDNWEQSTNLAIRQAPGYRDKSPRDEGLTGVALREIYTKRAHEHKQLSWGAWLKEPPNRGIPLAFATMESNWDAGRAHTLLPTFWSAKLS